MSGNLLSIEVNGVQAVVARFENYSVRTRLEISKALRGIAMDFQERVVTDKLSGGMVKRQTGNLAGSVRWQVDDTGDPMEATMSAGGVGSKAPYAKYVEYGTAPHQILPRKPGGVLAWKANSWNVFGVELGGGWVFAKKVNHPGTWERPFMRSTLEEMKEQIVMDIRDAANRAARAD